MRLCASSLNQRYVEQPALEDVVDFVDRAPVIAGGSPTTRAR
jgi:hypothetical protein